LMWDKSVFCGCPSKGTGDKETASSWVGMGVDHVAPVLADG
jgi:hypothetical protein